MVNSHLYSIKNLPLKIKLLIVYIIFLPLMKTIALPVVGEKIQFADLIFLIIAIACFRELMQILKYMFLQREIRLFSIFFSVTLISLIINRPGLNNYIELLGLLYLLLLLGIAAFIIRDHRTFILIIKSWVNAAILVATIGLLGLSFAMFKHAHNPFVLYHESVSSIIFFPRLIATFRNPNMLASYLHISLGLSLFLYFIETNATKRRWFIIGAIILFIAVIFTGSRIILGLLLTLLLFSLFNCRLKNRPNFLPYILGLAFILVLIFSIFSLRWTIYPLKFEQRDALKQQGIFYTYADSVYYMQYSAALKMISNNFLWGIGLGNFPGRFIDYTDWDRYKLTLQIEKSNGPFKSDPHSTYLGTFAETGIFGITILLFIFYFLLKNLFSIYNLYRTNQTYASFSFIAIAVLSGLLLNAFFVDIISMRHLWVFLALTIAQRNILKENKG